MEKKEKKHDEKELVLDDWQKEFLTWRGDTLLCTGRRVGKTTIYAIKAAQRMIEKKTEIVAISLTEDQAYIMHAFVLDYLEKHHPTYLKVKKKDKPTKNKIKLTNGSTYIVRPVGANGDSIRGFNADILIIDEASKISENAWAAATPTLLTTGGEIWMCSTPYGKQGYFWQSFDEAVNKKDPNARFKVFHISSEEVITNRPISETWTQTQREKALDLLEKEKRDKSEMEYGQEYLGLFLDELRQYFPDDWIDKVCTIDPKDTANIANRDYFLGVDIARLGDDETTFEIICKINQNNYVHVYNQIAKKWLTTQTEDRIIELTKTYKTIKKIYIDAGAGSLGVGVFDHLLRAPETRSKVEAINNRTIVLDKDGKKKQRLLKEDLYENLKALGERGVLKLLNSENIRLSLKSVQYEFTHEKEKPTQMRIFGNYTHIAEGLIRAAWCSKEKIINMDISYI